MREENRPRNRSAFERRPGARAAQPFGTSRCVERADETLFEHTGADAAEDMGFRLAHRHDAADPPPVEALRAAKP